ncbi:hypothetical protein COLO4_32117 [Corchorus olitorius]|uniref:Uncharacterized protein n=1 Tax=Corchorus olitorius TaxID=93759 RepID=A0A1R3H1G8_9ROSI|nr:hypothetical protein COLO4_32117 [Corchorus olitorius]
MESVGEKVSEEGELGRGREGSRMNGKMGMNLPVRRFPERIVSNQFLFLWPGGQQTQSKASKASCLIIGTILRKTSA